MPTRVILIRHGETEWNAFSRWQGHAPVPLNKTGVKQAEFAATYLIEQSISHIISSDLQRACTTAEIIADELDLTVIMDKRLRECDLGNWQGLTLEEVEAWDLANLKKFRDDPFNVPRPGGESSQQAGQRCYEALDDYVHQYPNATLLVVSHGGTINSVLQTLFPDFVRQGLSNTSLTELHYNNEEPKWSLVAVGETPHLPVPSTEGR
jgi:broad specificity phosphatase PhoE